MALLNDLKKLLFGAKAVTKSAAGKAVDAGKEAGHELAEKTGDLWEKAKDKAEDVGEVIMDKTGDAMDKMADFTENIGSKVLQATEVAKDKAKDLADEWSGKPSAMDTGEIMDDIIAESKAAPKAEEPEETLELPLLTNPRKEEPKLLEAPDDEPGILENLEKSVSTVGSSVLSQSEKTMDKAADMVEGVGKKVLETSGRLTEKFGETAEDIGSALFEKSGEAMEKAKGFAEDLGSKILKAKDDLVKKANEEAAKSGETTDSLIDKAKDLGQKLEDKISGNNTKFADKPLDMGGSEFKKHESFWEKAERFAQGDHHMKGTQPKPGEMKIQNDPDYKAPEKGKVKGFDDADGDGDELIDDAIIDG